MSSEINSYSPNLQRKLLGEILLEAGLISPSQLEMALADQNQFFMLKLGEILALRGWLKQETIDFFVDKIINHLDNDSTSNPQYIGQYFQEAGLLTEEQIKSILQEQKKLGIKFGYLAVLKGFLKEQTLTFFLEKLIKSPLTKSENQITSYAEVIEDQKETLLFSSFDDDIDEKDTLPSPSSLDTGDLNTEDKDTITFSGESTEEKTIVFANYISKEIQEEMVITPHQTITLTNQHYKAVYCNEIAYSSIWIDE